MHYQRPFPQIHEFDHPLQSIIDEVETQTIIDDNRRSEMSCRNWMAYEKLPAEDPKFKVTRILVGKKQEVFKQKEGVVREFVEDPDALPLFDIEILYNQPDPMGYDSQLDAMGCDTEYDPRCDYAICQHNAVITTELMYKGAYGQRFGLEMVDKHNPAKHLDMFHIAKRLDCPHWLASAYVDTFAALELDRTTVNKLIDGFNRADGSRAAGLALSSACAAAGKVPALERSLNKLESFADEMKAADVFTINDARREAQRFVEKHYYRMGLRRQAFKVDTGEIIPKSSGFEWANKVEGFAKALMDWEREEQREADSWDPLTDALSFDELTNGVSYWRVADPDMDGDQADDPDYNFAKGSDAAAFTGRPLFDTTEAMGHEFLTYLRFANLEQLEAVRYKLRLYKSYKEGRRPLNNDEWEKLGKYRFLTRSQVGQIWRYVKDRENQLTANIVVSSAVEHTLEIISRNGLGKRTKAYALSHMNGKSFNDHGTQINFQRPTKAEQRLIFNALYA